MKQTAFKTWNHFFADKKKRSVENQLLKNIRAGFEKGEFKMHLQFIIDGKSGKIASAEALSRWENSLGEVQFPGVYVNLMERNEQIVEFDYYMFDKVCKKLSEWHNTEFSHLSVSCNITRITISEKDFVKEIRAIADRYDFDRSKMVIEITEDAIEKDLEVARCNVAAAKEIGFTVALDDLGSGYTSLAGLCKYPIDIVKVDRNVLLLAENEKGKDMFSGIVSFIHGLGFKAVCEGVETEEQKELAIESGFDYIQGWYYCKALPETRAEEFYREYMKKF